MSAWHKACRFADLREGEPLGVKIDRTQVGLFRVGERCYAVDDICTHEYALLSGGCQDGEIVECPLHQATFSVVTGKCLALPAEEDLATYEVKIEGGDVFVRLAPPASGGEPAS